jgi:Ca2+-binding EF-hand superfamily protein
VNAIFHVFNILGKRGVSIEDCFRHRDAQKNGFLKKKSFIAVFQQVGVPLALKDLIKVARAYAHPQSQEHVDYEKLLRDFSLRTSQVDVSQTSIEGSVSIEGTLDEVKIPRNVLLDLKAALMELMSGQGKSIDDVYGVFVRWDSKGTGTITSAQFLRVLDRLHVNMSDEDQDTIVEILDYDSSGKIHYEGLLDSCFPQLNFGGAIRDSLAVDELSENASISGGSLAASVEAAPRDPKPLGGKKGRPQTASSSRPTTFILTDNCDNESLSAMGNSSPANYRPKRPLTAAPRLFKTEYESRREKRQGSIEANFVSDPFVIEVSDSDNIIDDEPHVPFRSFLNPYSDGNSLEFGTFNVDVESFNDNTLLSDQDEFIFPSPRSPTDGGRLKQQFYTDPNTLGRQQQPGQRSYYPVQPTKEITGKVSTRDTSSGYSYEDYRSSVEVQAEPKDHLILLATQSLATLREMILARRFTGKSMKDIFHHFDRKGKFYFDAKDLMVGMADLRIETSEKVADLMISLLAVDGHDKVSFGEFSVFVTDNDHLELERDVQSQVAEQLERQGRDYQMHLYNAFWDNIDAAAGVKSGMVGRALFERSLARLGILLNSSDIQRLITRFSIHGQDQCSVTRFLRMVQNSAAWRKSEKMLAIKEEAIEEAQTVIAQLQQGVELVPGLTLDIIHMAEYLGIRVLSEPSLLWIASEAFVAPLPTGWITSKDKEGRLFFYNSANNISQWDHPLDNHFRTLRDKHRYIVLVKLNFDNLNFNYFSEKKLTQEIVSSHLQQMYLTRWVVLFPIYRMQRLFLRQRWKI